MYANKKGYIRNGIHVRISMSSIDRDRGSDEDPKIYNSEMHVPAFWDLM